MLMIVLKSQTHINPDNEDSLGANNDNNKAERKSKKIGPYKENENRKNLEREARGTHVFCQTKEVMVRL